MSKSNGGTSESTAKPAAAKKDHPKHWTCTGPSDSEPQEKTVTVEGKNVLFKRWSSGAKAHLTSEKNAPSTTIAAHSLQASDDINFGLFAAETNFDGPIPGGFLETYYKFHPESDSHENDDGSYDDGSDWNLIQEGDGTPLHRPRFVTQKVLPGSGKGLQPSVERQTSS